MTSHRRSHAPRLLFLDFDIAFVVAAIVALVVPAAAAQPSRTPVVVELFTSQSCAECPPAHALLHSLEKSPFTDGAEILPLQMHVDLWNEDWADPYGSPFLSGRQRQYAGALGADVEAPFFVVDGSSQLVGADRAALRTLIARAAKEQKATIALRFRDELLEITVDAVPAEHEGDALIVWLVAAQSGLKDTPAGGANAGKSIAHAPVVRDMAQVGLVTEGFFERQLPVNPRDLDDVRWVVLLQSMRTSRIVGAKAIAHPSGASGLGVSSASARSAAGQATGKPIAEDEAIRRAEAFVVANGYTDRPHAPLSQIAWEPLEFETDKERLLLRRARTLRAAAYGVSPGRKDGSPGFTVFFSQTHATSNGRVVTMNPDGSGIRMESGELPLKNATRKR